ncbi:MAG: hypothetical protein AB7H93_23630 [Vicinamibacterales bacterium]
MAEREVTVRLTVRDAEQAAAALRRIGGDGEGALRRLEAATAPASRGLLSLDRAAAGAQAGLQRFGAVSAVLPGQLGNVLSRVTALSGALSAGGLAFTAGAAGLGLFAAALVKTTTAAEAFERSQFKTEALLRVTGQASGQTAASIEQLAVSIGRSTLASTEEVRAAANQLLTFKTVAGDAFARTLRVSQDLAANGFGSVASNATRLAKALEDPTTQLAQLRESGISFSATQIEMIKGMSAAGREAEALDAILSNVEAQVGGTGAAETQGLAGAFDTLTENFARFTEEVGRRSGVLDFLAGAMKRIADGSTAVVESFSLDNQFLAAMERLDAARARVAELEGETPAGGLGARSWRAALTEAQREAEAAQAEVARINRLLITAGDDAARARDNAAEAAAERAAERRAVADKEAAEERAKATAKADEAERKRRLEIYNELQRAERELLTAGLDGIERLAAERDRDLAEARAARDAQLTDHETYARQVAAIEERYRREKAKLDADAAEKAAEAAKRAAEKSAAEQARAAEKAAEEFRRVTDRATDRVTDFAADAFYDKLTGRTGDFWETFKETGLRTIAQLAAEMAFRPIIAPVVQSVVGGIPGAFGLSGASAAAGGGAGGGLGGAGSLLGSLGNFGGSIDKLGYALGFGTAFDANAGLATGAGYFDMPVAGAASPWTSATLSGTLGAAGLGAAGGGLLAQLTGGNSTWGAVGGGLGAGLGFVVGGPWGAAIGGAAGGALGGMLGGSASSVGPNAMTNLLYENGRFSVGSSGADNGADTATTSALARQAADYLEGLRAQYGLSINVMGLPRHDFFIRQGAGTSRGFTSPEGLVDAVLAGGGLTSGNATLDRVLRQSTSADVAANLQTVSGLLALLDEIDLSPETITASEQAIEAINRQFEDLAAQAERFGIATDKLEAARAKAIEGVGEGFRDGIEAQLKAFTDPLGQALDALGEAQAARVREAEQLGADLVAVEALNARERAAVIARYNATADASLKRLLDDFTFGALATTSPAATVEGLRASFNAAAAQASAGDAGARERAAELGRALVEASRTAFASSPAYQTVRDEVQATVAALVATGAGGGDVVGALNAGFDDTVGMLGDILRANEALTAEVARLRAAHEHTLDELQRLRLAA